MRALRANRNLTKFAGPGGWNDPDMLVGSSEHAAAHITPTQSRTQFSMWAVMAAPLLIGSNLLNMSVRECAYLDSACPVDWVISQRLVYDYYFPCTFYSYYYFNFFFDEC